MSFAIDLAEKGWVPDSLIRRGIRSLLRKRLRDAWEGVQGPEMALCEAIEEFGQGPLAIHTQAANDQHYEVPPRFFQLALGRHLKYSSCYYENAQDNLDVAEARMLDLTMERAELIDGQDILEIGCGWGSLTLSMAQRFPNSRITAVSNSAPQRLYIEGQCAERGLTNVTVITKNLVELELDATFDRIVSVECFEHMRNYRELFRRLAQWLRDDGKCFIHVFCHSKLSYPFEDKNGGDWMARHFFTGGTMPSFDLLPSYNEYLSCEEKWPESGKHYGQTSLHWLENTDLHKDEIIELFRKDLGEKEAKVQWRRWRIFFMACEECFNFNNGSEWLVGHYRFTRKSPLISEKSLSQEAA